MNGYIYYEDNHGIIHQESDIEDAYQLVSGKYRYESQQDYLKFLYSLLGKSIVGVAVYKSKRSQAILEYKRNHECSLTEAHKVIEKEIEECFK